MTKAPAPFRAGPPRWKLRDPPDSEVAERLASDLNLRPTLGRLLAVRGVTGTENARAHLRPLLCGLSDPGTLAGLDEAVARIERALQRNETILVHGDYDVDGVAAAALFTRWLRRLGGRVEPFVPHRLREGYDLGEAGLARAKEVGASLLLTADCGIVAHEAVARAAEHGLDVVVTDHHTPGATLPPALAIVNPAREDCPFGEPLCGTGVVFKVVQALAARHGVDEEEVFASLDLVALATIADLVPLTGENRTLVRYGLRALARTENPGLRALMDVCGLAGGELESGQVGFVLAPRLNAVGRLGDAGDALRLLLTEDAVEARALAESAETINRARQDEDRRTLDEALAQLAESFDPMRDFGVVLAAEGWHPGVIGIVASRVAERVHRPVVLVALRDGWGRGSARSIPGFHLYEALAACSHLLDRFGGHRQAAGMELSADRMDEFRAAFCDEARAVLEGLDLRREVTIDLPLGLEQADLELADLLRYLGPHGMGNPRPAFVARGVRVVGRAKEVGRGHLKLRLESAGITRPAIGFGMADAHDPGGLAGERVDIVFQLTVNEYRGRRTAQLRLVDLRPAGGESP